MPQGTVQSVKFHPVVEEGQLGQGGTSSGPQASPDHPLSWPGLLMAVEVLDLNPSFHLTGSQGGSVIPRSPGFPPTPYAVLQSPCQAPFLCLTSK